MRNVGGTSAVSKWKPLKVKVNSWGVDFNYILILAPRDGNVADLQREIKRTLQKVLPSERIPQFSYITRENDRVFLPPWSDLEISLRDNEEVLLGYGDGEISRKGPSKQPVISGEVSDIHRFTETDTTTTIASRSNSRRLQDDAPIIASNTEQEECSMLTTKAANMTSEVEAAEQSGLMIRLEKDLQAREATKITSNLVEGEVSLDKQDDKSKKMKHKKAKREDVEFQTAINDEAITDQESLESRKRSKKRRKEKNRADTVRTEELSGRSKRKKKIKTDYETYEGGIAETTTIASTSNSCRLLDDAPIITSNTEQEKCSFMLSTKEVDEKPPRAANMTGEVEAAEQSGLMMRLEKDLQTRKATEITSSLVAGEVSLDKQDDKSNKRKHKKAKREDVEFQTAINDEAITDQESSESRKRSKKRRKEKNGTDTVRTEELSDGSKRKKKIKLDSKIFEGGITDTTDRELESKEPEKRDSMADLDILDVTSQQPQKRNNLTQRVKRKWCFPIETDSEASDEPIPHSFDLLCNEIVDDSDYEASPVVLPLTEGMKSKHKDRHERSVIRDLKTSIYRARKFSADVFIDHRMSPIELLRDNLDDESGNKNKVAKDKGKAFLKDKNNLCNNGDIPPTQDKTAESQIETVITNIKSKNGMGACTQSSPSSLTFSVISTKIGKHKVQKKGSNETKEAEETVNQSTKEDKTEPAERKENNERKTKRKKSKKTKSSRPSQETKEAEETVNQSTKEDKSEAVEKKENTERKTKRKKRRKNRSSRSFLGDSVNFKNK